jgi:outer membrane immunogenic protein
MGVACCVLAGAASAQAADLPVKALAPPVPAFSWTGFYVGADVGAAWDRAKVDPPLLSLEPVAFTDVGGAFTGIPGNLVFIPGTIPLPATVTGSSNKVSFIGGGHAGYNWQAGHLVLGVEGDLRSSDTSTNSAATLAQTFAGLTTNVSRSLTANITVERSWEASARGRVGYAWDRLMVFGTAGVSFTDLHARTTFTAVTTLGPPLTPIPGLANPAGTTSGGDSRTLTGGTVGAGFEYLATKSIVVGAEYRYTHYNSKSFNLGTTPAGFVPSTAPGPANIGLDTQQVTARISYLFGRP